MPAPSGMSAALLPVRRGLGPSSAGTWDLSFKMALKAAPKVERFPIGQNAFRNGTLEQLGKKK